MVLFGFGIGTHAVIAIHNQDGKAVGESIVETSAERLRGFFRGIRASNTDEFVPIKQFGQIRFGFNREASRSGFICLVVSYRTPFKSSGYWMNSNFMGCANHENALARIGEFFRTSRLSTHDRVGWCEGPMSRDVFESMKIGTLYTDLLTHAGPPVSGTISQNGFVLVYTAVPLRRTCKKCAEASYVFSFTSNDVLKGKKLTQIW